MTKIVSSNFPKLLRSIVGSELKKYGFKQKSTRFIREINGIKDEIYFQRSQFNVSGYSQMFYLNLYSINEMEDKGGGIRLDYPSGIQFPEFGNIEPFDYDSFTQEQKYEYDNWYFNKFWEYSTEEALIEVLEKAKELILDKGFCFFEEIQKLTLEEKDKEKIYREVLTIDSRLNGINKVY